MCEMLKSNTMGSIASYHTGQNDQSIRASESDQLSFWSISSGTDSVLPYVFQHEQAKFSKNFERGKECQLYENES